MNAVTSRFILRMVSLGLVGLGVIKPEHAEYLEVDPVVSAFLLSAIVEGWFFLEKDFMPWVKKRLDRSEK